MQALNFFISIQHPTARTARTRLGASDQFDGLRRLGLLVIGFDLPSRNARVGPPGAVHVLNLRFVHCRYPFKKVARSTIYIVEVQDFSNGACLTPAGARVAAVARAFINHQLGYSATLCLFQSSTYVLFLEHVFLLHDGHPAE
jgi:hypothetical protein